ncbi:hypothetical protein ABPG74_022766 [Tetrahymena malaccensis]
MQQSSGNLTIQIKPLSQQQQYTLDYQVLCKNNDFIQQFNDPYNDKLLINQAFIQLPQQCSQIGSIISISYIVLQFDPQLSSENFYIDIFDKTVCPFQCQGQGYCQSNGVCACNKPYGGRYCNIIQTQIVSNRGLIYQDQVVLKAQNNYIYSYHFMPYAENQGSCQLNVYSQYNISYYLADIQQNNLISEDGIRGSQFKIQVIGETVIIFQAVKTNLFQINYTCQNKFSFEYYLLVLLACLLSPFAIWLIYNILYKIYQKFISKIKRKKIYQQVKIEELQSPLDNISIKDLNLKSYVELLCNICSQQIQDNLHITQNYQIYHKNCYKDKQEPNQEEIQPIKEEEKVDLQKSNENQEQKEDTFITQQTIKQLENAPIQNFSFVENQKEQLEQLNELNEKPNSQQKQSDDDSDNSDYYNEQDEDQISQQPNKIKSFVMQNNKFN